MGEICSMYPSAGGLYVWAATLAPRNGAAWGWFTAWFNILGQIACTAAIDYGLATLIYHLIAYSSPGAVAAVASARAVIVGFTVAILIVQGLLIAKLSARASSKMSDFSALWHVFGTLVILIVVASAPSETFRSRSFVFTDVHDASGFESKPYAFLLGFLLSQYTLTYVSNLRRFVLPCRCRYICFVAAFGCMHGLRFFPRATVHLSFSFVHPTSFSDSGYEASASVSEETLNPARSAPRGIIFALACSISFGWVLLISLAFHISDYDALAARYGSAAVLGVFDYAVGSPGAPILGAVLVVAQFFCGFSSLESNSRTVFAFARDGGLPLSRLWSYLTATHKVGLFFALPRATFCCVLYSICVCVCMCWHLGNRNIVPVCAYIRCEKPSPWDPPLLCGAFLFFVGCLAWQVPVPAALLSMFVALLLVLPALYSDTAFTGVTSIRYTIGDRNKKKTRIGRVRVRISQSRCKPARVE